MFARSTTQQQSMIRFKKCKTLCESPSQKKLHLVVQVNTNPILYFPGILTSLFNMSKLISIY